MGAAFSTNGRASTRALTWDEQVWVVGGAITCPAGRKQGSKVSREWRKSLRAGGTDLPSCKPCLLCLKGGGTRERFPAGGTVGRREDGGRTEEGGRERGGRKEGERRKEGGREGGGRKEGRREGMRERGRKEGY